MEKRIDRSTEKGVNAAKRLESQRIAWLTTVGADGTPQASPIWYLWDGHEFLIYSLDAARVRNIRRSPRVSINLDSDGLGGDIVVVEGTARIDDEAPSAADNADYLAKYKSVMDNNKWSPEWFAGRYSVPVRIVPTGFRYW